VTLTPSPLLDIRKLTKRFPGVLALEHIDFQVLPGEVHALVGENGAGKSTLMKIIAGVYDFDEGEVHWKGQPVHFRTPRQAQDAGIVTIYQELNQVPQLSVAENIFLGGELMRGAFIDWPTMMRRSREMLARLHLEINPRTPVGELGVAKQQMVEIAKALHHKADLLILDEPTSALSLTETEYLFQIMRELKAQGVSIIYISHHLEECFQIGDRITVLRDGHHIETRPASAFNMDSLISLMVGRDLTEQYPKEAIPRGREMLRVDGLTQGERLQDISFSAYAGEILGIAGLVGAGRTELVRAIFGADPIDSGRISIEGQPVTIRSPQDAIRHGMGLLTEDRKRQGLILGLSTRENTTLSVLERLRRLIFTDERKERDLTQTFIDRFAIKTPGQDQLVINLSGGTQQKVVLSKWMATEPRVLIFDEPTRGIDVGAKVEIYRLMNQLARDGVAILMVSSELTEILGMSDRILVLGAGRVQTILDRAEATQESILHYATGTAQAAVGASA
jgi:ribose transport system ATP-binding protein